VDTNGCLRITGTSRPLFYPNFMGTDTIKMVKLPTAVQYTFGALNESH
jgi:hypothetical protein